MKQKNVARKREKGVESNCGTENSLRAPRETPTQNKWRGGEKAVNCKRRKFQKGLIYKIAKKADSGNCKG